METKTRPEAKHDYSKEVRLYDDTTTWLAEVLPGVMRTPFEYRFDGKELYGRDGSAMFPIFHSSIKHAETMIEERPNLLFELRRRTIEMEEYHDMVKMMHGELPNTMIVVSDFPPELMDAQDDLGGYNVKRKQAMIRVITREADGRLAMISQSLDGSNRTALEALYNEFGLTPADGELLGQRIHLQLEDESRKQLADHLTDIYDKRMTQQFGGSWCAGRKVMDRQGINTFDFVRQQTDLLTAALSQAQDGVLSQQSLYDLASAMKQRFERFVNPTVNVAVAPLMYYRDRFEELAMAGQFARSRNQSYAGCGLAVGASIAAFDTEGELSENGYGNKADATETYTFDKVMYCVVCQAPPKETEKKKLCGPCGICKHCDKSLKRKP